MSEQPEEDWEAEIGRLLGDLPMIEPPEGFLDRAVDRPPLYAGRTTALALLASIVAVLVVGTTGLLNEETLVPDLNVLVNRHSATEASLFGGVIASGAENAAPVFVLVTDQDTSENDSLLLPSEFEWEASFDSDDISQGVYSTEGQAVSVFTEQGQVDFTSMPSSGLAEIGDVMVWADPSRKLIIVQAADSVVTVVGLDPQDVTPGTLTEITAGLEAEDDRSLLGRVGRGVNLVTRQLGYPDLS